MATKLNAHELDELDATELESKLREAKEELFNLRFQAATGQLEKASRVKEVRRSIARIKTQQTERSRSAAK